MRRFAEALEIFRASHEIFEREGNSYWLGILDLYRAEVHCALQAYSEALTLATSSRDTFDRISIPSKRILSRVLIGRIALAQGDIDYAKACTSEVFTLIQTTDVPLLLFSHYILCGEVAERSLRPKDAIRFYELAAQDLDLHQTRLQHDDLRVTFFQQRYKAYESLLWLTLDVDTLSADIVAAGFAWCERAKSRALIELLSCHLPSVHAQAEQWLLLKINRLREELNIHYARSQPEVRPIPSASNFDAISIKEQELARSLREVSIADPEYASLQKVSIVSLEEFQSSIPDDTTVLEYCDVRGEILAFAISRNDARVFRALSSDRDSLNLHHRLAFQLEKFLIGEDYVRAHEPQMLAGMQRHLQHMYRNLVAPVVGFVKTPHLTIIPHGALHFLPFHAFHDGSEYLIDQFEVAYAPSASVLKYCLDKPDISGAAPLLVGVTDENTPFVTREIADLKGAMPEADVLENDQATRAAFVRAAARSKSLHVATHAIFRQDNPMFSSFKLADGWVTALDLFSMRCETNLVTLSGCKSGVSHVTGNDDLLGLLRGFLYGGARSLLLSLWNVDDESAAQLMAHFYRAWKGGARKSHALRAAMVAVRQDRPNPFHWAPFRLIGKSS
jgi:CHAT domain-containing protein